MAKKNSFTSTLVVMGVIAAVVLVGTTYFEKIHNSSKQTVLAATTSTTPTKAGEVASAAYSKCVQNGGFVTTARRGNWGYYNVCNFADDMNCELYALYNGQCPVGGVKTVGYNTTPQVFCALRGGQPMGTNNGQCKMPDGKTCSTDSVYNGTCEPI